MATTQKTQHKTETEETHNPMSDLPEAMMEAWTRAAEAWNKAAVEAAKDPEGMVKAWEEAAVAWLDHVVQSPPALAAMFAPLATFLQSNTQRDRAAEQWMHWQRTPTLSDTAAMLNVLRIIQSQLMDLSDRMGAVEDRIKSIDERLARHKDERKTST
jgi:hypothetical protein